MDVYHTLSPPIIDWILFPQFVPSLVRFLTDPIFATTGFIVVSVLTLLTGRVYCSTVCPLGILMDFVIGCKNRYRNIRSLPLKKSPLTRYYADHRSISVGFRKKYSIRIFSLVKYLILFFVTLAILCRSMLLLGILDPYSMAGKIFVTLFRPLFLMVSNMVIMAGNVLTGSGAEKTVPVSFEFDSIFVFSFIVSVILVFISWIKDRWYCNVICPVGTVLGFLARFSVFRLRIDLTRCTHCGTCRQVCKAGCIHPDDYHIEPENCVGCFDCIDVCREKGVVFGIIKPRIRIPGYKLGGDRKGCSEGEITRRRFIGFVLTAFSTLAFKGVSVTQDQDFKQSVGDDETMETIDSTPATPPGSIGLSHFTETCTSCHLCISVCPPGVLQPAFLEYGLQGIFQPRMDFHSGYCYTDCIRCSEVCPTGAILTMDPDKKRRLKTGSALFIRNLCLVHTERRSCGMCAAGCREKAIRLVPWLGDLVIPDVDDQKCTGCGACEYVCPVRPQSAIVVEALAEHQMLQ